MIEFAYNTFMRIHGEHSHAWEGFPEAEIEGNVSEVLKDVMRKQLKALG